MTLIYQLFWQYAVGWVERQSQLTPLRVYITTDCPSFSFYSLNQNHQSFFLGHFFGHPSPTLDFLFPTKETPSVSFSLLQQKSFFFSLLKDRDREDTLGRERERLSRWWEKRWRECDLENTSWVGILVFGKGNFGKVKFAINTETGQSFAR